VHSPIRIGHCIDTFAVGGTELNAVRTLEAFDRERFEFTVFHLREDGPLRSRYERLGVRLVHLPTSRLYSARTLRQGLRFAQLLRQLGIQIVHTHDLYTNIFAVPWARLGTRCAVIASRRWLYEAPRPGLVAVNRWACRWASRVLANSSAVAQILVAEGVAAENVAEIPNFVGSGAFQRADEEARTAQRLAWGVPEGAFVVGTVARLVPVKNHEMLLRAVRRLGDDIHVVLIGDGPARAALERLADEFGIRSRVHFTGELLSASNLHQYFDVSVLCSFSEGFPNSVIEALAAQVPVVATPVGGVSEIIVDNESGLLIPLNDIVALRTRLQSLYENPSLRQRLASAGLARVQARYAEGAVIGKLASLYQELAAAPGQQVFARP
jgi:glycosyltransferase involved in cell wall biosynthesis